jgi:Protein of unknown function (DUF1186)/SEC-C motif
MTKRSRRRADFPVATIAAYGPDNTLATKLVVSILQRPESSAPPVMRSWTTETADARSDPNVAAEIAAFISDCRVKRTVGADRIIGCPHEEGIDYPMGRTCPQCSFWAGIDRFTHEPIRAPVPSMPAEDVVRVLTEDAPDEIEEALESADAHREALVGPLLDALQQAIVNPTGASKEDASIFSYALYLLAKWREPRAYPYVIRWLSLPDDEPFDIGGDIVTEDGARILAAVCDGTLEPIQTLILNRKADEYGRSEGVTALALLAAWGEVPRTLVIDWLMWLACEGLEREPSAVWDSLAAACADIEALELFPELRRAYEDELIDPVSVAQFELDAVETTPRGETVRRTREGRPPITDVDAETAWWDRRSQSTDDEDDLLLDDNDDWDEADGHTEIPEPYHAPPKVGRNEPCPCGSGKKFKKCCGR